jgi:hypothetical protein
MNQAEAKKKYDEAGRLFLAQRFEEALVILELLDRTFPDTPEFLYSRGCCLVELGRVFEGRQVFSRMEKQFGKGRWSTVKRRTRTLPDRDPYGVVEPVQEAPIQAPAKSGATCGVIAAFVLFGFLFVGAFMAMSYFAGVSPELPAVVEAAPDSGWGARQ